MTETKRVDIKFLELEIDAFRKKLNLHEEVAKKIEVTWQAVNEPIADPEHIQLIASVTQKHEIILQLNGIIEENQHTERNAIENFEKFKAEAHRKSISECGEIIFEMRRLLSQLNMYKDFRKNEGILKKNCELLEHDINTKISNFENEMERNREHVHKQKLLIMNKIWKTLNSEAFRIGWQNMKGSDHYLRVKHNNVGLQEHIGNISKLTNCDNKQKSRCIAINRQKKAINKELVKKVSHLTEEIDFLTGKIEELRKANEEKFQKLNEVVRHSILMFHDAKDFSSVAGEDSQSRTGQDEELDRERKTLDETKVNLCRYYAQYGEMLEIKNQILKLATLVAKLGTRPPFIAEGKFSCERGFEEYETENFLDNILIMLDRPYLFTEDDEIGETEETIAGTVASFEVVNLPLTTVVEDLNIFSIQQLLSSYCSNASPATSARSVLIDVEDDIDVLEYEYEEKKEIEEPQQDEISHGEVAMGGSSDYLM